MKKTNCCSLLEKHSLFESQNRGSGATLVFWKNLQDMSSHCTQIVFWFFFPTLIDVLSLINLIGCLKNTEKKKPNRILSIFSSLGKFCPIIAEDIFCFWWREVVIYKEFNLWCFVLCTISMQKRLLWVWFESYYLRCVFLIYTKKENLFTFF